MILRINGGAEVMLPATMPSECNERCTFAWTWSPRVSQACEIYMNCADIQVVGAVGDDTAHPVSINFQTAFIDQGPSDPVDPIIEHYGCVRADEVSHWTTIFGEIDTNYDYTDNEHEVVTDPDPVDPVVDGNTVCYSNPSMAINLDAEIGTSGACGTGPNDYRCDDGSCCGEYGFCGTTDEYCNNALADWRVTACDDSSSTSTTTTSTSTTTTTASPASSTSSTAASDPIATTARFVS